MTIDATMDAIHKYMYEKLNESNQNNPKIIKKSDT